MPRSRRPTALAIQNDLTWGGDFTGPIDGEFSERLVAAVKAYQTRHKNPVTGVMSPEERAALASAVEPRKQEVGWRLTEDPVTGARVGLPGKLATKIMALPNGTRWSSEQGQLQVETFRIDTGATLDAVFDQQKKMPRRRIENSALQADSFAISGMQGLKKMVGARLRARTARCAASPSSTTRRWKAPSIRWWRRCRAPSCRLPPASRWRAADAPRRKVEYGTGVFVSAVGHVADRPQSDRRLQRRSRCRASATPSALATDPGRRTRAAARLRRAQPHAGRHRRPRRAAATSRSLASPIRRRRAAGLRSPRSRQARRCGRGRPLETVPALGFAGAAASTRRATSPASWRSSIAVVAGPAGAPQAGRGAGRRDPQFPRGELRRAGVRTLGVEAAKASVTRVICVRK